MEIRTLSITGRPGVSPPDTPDFYTAIAADFRTLGFGPREARLAVAGFPPEIMARLAAAGVPVPSGNVRTRPAHLRLVSNDAN
jgi:hypothetical protein